MGEYRPLIAFLLITVVLNVFVYQAYASFDEPFVLNPDVIPSFLKPYFSIKDIIDTLQTTLAGVSIFGFPLGDLISFIMTVLTGLLFSDPVAQLILIWAMIPLPIFLIIGVPMMAGMFYALIKALPTT